MRIKSSSTLITSVVLLLTACNVAATIYAYNLVEHRRTVSENLLKAINAANDFLTGSDTLTTAIRGYAATGNVRYRDDFKRELAVTRSRERALEELQQVGLTTSEMELFQEAKNNSDALVHIEDEAAAAVAEL